MNKDAKIFLNSLPWIPSRSYIRMVNVLCKSEIFQKLDMFWGISIDQNGKALKDWTN